MQKTHAEAPLRKIGESHIVHSMTRTRFSLTSDQLELLLAFQESQGLNHLAEMMAKDPSVVSRGLQRIAETHPVLTKVRGRWEITPLGREINLLTQEFVAKHETLLGSSVQKPSSSFELAENSVLVVINAQCGLIDSTQPGRNNLEAEKNISLLLTDWRRQKRKVLHVKHVSENPSSVFYRHADGSDFLPGFEPVLNEPVIEKTKSSAFQETRLENELKKNEPSHLILVGFTANECIDATARDAASLGFSAVVVSDATAMFDMKAPDGKLIKADRLHRLTLANLNAFYAKVLNTSQLLKNL